MLDEVFRRSSDFDIVHFHIDYLHFPLSRRTRARHITTLHGRLDLPELTAVYRQFPDMPLVSISDAQREPVPWARWLATVYHGVPEHLYHFHERPGSYLAFIGRISPEKGIDRAIDAAIRAGMPLRIAAKIDKVDREYFEAHIQTKLDHPLIEFVGEIAEYEKSEFLGGACALLFLIDWPEPFGLAMIEALACGTPVIGFRRGSVPEVIEDGVTGFVVDELDEAVEAIDKIGSLNRKDCRTAAEAMFSASRMATDYLVQYAHLHTNDPTAVDSNAALR
jgi:glycosyltransferase involved in cell wall biosynthesis